MEMCDHIIAHGYEDSWGGFIHASERDEMFESVLDSKRHWYAQDGGWESIKRVMERWTCVYDFIADELELFAFCPKCGTKIDWSPEKEKSAGVTA